MISLAFLLGAIALSALTGYITYREDKARKRPLPLKDISLMKWLQSDHHWHSFGHYFMDMSITFVSSVFISAILNIFNAGAVPFGVSTTLGLTAFTFLAMVPSSILTLYIEIVNDGHWKAFLGREPWMAAHGGDVRDFLFDLFTHLAGGACAALILCAYWAL